MEKKRYLKDIVSVNKGNRMFNPVSSTMHISTKNPICLTKFNIQNNTSKIYNEYMCNHTSSNYKEYLFIPPIGLLSQDIVNIYNIETIDNLDNWMDNNLKTSNIFTIDRILNCWIRVNYDTLINYNNYLEKIINKIVNEFYFDRIKNMEEKELNKEIKYFIDYWINKNNENEYSLLIISDFIHYLQKKSNK
jgi:hypothetical protein